MNNCQIETKKWFVYESEQIKVNNDFKQLKTLDQMSF